ncbi:hypothetical protein SLS60_001130 [Paraconiothyrium brasiliense]|uniref:Uncharacterized protein n=1 Tax=Paraconiothyrium brasiliense TaxID=300254 RepID=A0ABR3S8D0_9PLEO
MTPFWDSISRAFGRSSGLTDSEDDYLPPAPSGKRKASTSRRSSQPRKVRRSSAPSSFAGARGAYLATREEEERDLGSRNLAQGQVGLPEVPDEDERSPRVTSFIGHRNSLDREPLRRSSGRRGSAYGGSAASQSRHSGRPGSNGEPAAESEKPVSTEADIQARLLANYSDDSDGELSEGEWGRKHFGPPPWVSHELYVERVARVDNHFDDQSQVMENPEPAATPAIESTPETGTGTPAPKLSFPSGPETKMQPVSQMKPLKLKKPVKETAVKPVAKPTSKPITKATIEPSEYLKEWKAAPSQRLRTIMEEYGQDPSACVEKVLKELQEPFYSLRDVEIRDMLWQIQDGMEHIADLFEKAYPNETSRERETMHMARAYGGEARRDVSTSRVMECVVGSRLIDKGETYDIFGDKDKRRAFVCGVIGNVLVEQVFKHPFLGGDAQTIDALFDQQKDNRGEEAFTRKFYSASLLKTHLFGNSLDTSILNPPENFTTHVDTVVVALDRHLSPLLNEFLPLFRGQEAKDRYHRRFLIRLTRVVGAAALLSLQMAADPCTVYYFTPVAKGDRFEPKAHEAVNEEEMERTHPRGPETVFPSEEARKRARNDEAVVSMVLMHGLTAYRKGGWEAPKSNPVWDGEVYVGRLYEKEEYVDMGLREKVLTRGWVYCKWGKAERLERGKVAVKKGKGES